jgi:hypothetical protein
MIKKQFEPEIKISKIVKNQANIGFVEKIINKYGITKLKSQFMKLILRQNSRILGSENKETNFVNNTVLKNYSDYRSVSKSTVLNLTKYVAGLINKKSNKELQVPFNILNDKNNNTLSAKNSVPDSNTIDRIHKNPSRQHSGTKETGNTLKTTALINQVLKKYDTNISKYVSYNNNPQVKETSDNKLENKKHGRILNEGLRRITRIISEPISILRIETFKNQLKTIESQQQPQNKRHFSTFINMQRKNQNLFYDKNHQSGLNELKPEFRKNIDFNNKSLQDGFNNEERKPINSRVSPIRQEQNSDTDPVQDKNIELSVKKVHPPEKQKQPGNDEMVEAIRHELVLNTQASKSMAGTLTKKSIATKTQCFIKDALVQADGAISKVIKKLSPKKVDIYFQKRPTERNIYNDSTELIPAQAVQLKKTKGAKPEQKQKMKSFLSKNDDGSLILCKPRVGEAAVEAEQIHSDVMASKQGVFAKAVSISKPDKSINDLGNEEVNIIAEKVLKVLEKRMAIQKDRRGLR